MIKKEITTLLAKLLEKQRYNENFENNLIYQKQRLELLKL